MRINHINNNFEKNKETLRWMWWGNRAVSVKGSICSVVVRLLKRGSWEIFQYTRREFQKGVNRWPFYKEEGGSDNVFVIPKYLNPGALITFNSSPFGGFNLSESFIFPRSITNTLHQSMLNFLPIFTGEVFRYSFRLPVSNKWLIFMLCFSSFHPPS